jgi:magnesium-transporting ATPase (P-type)
MFGLLIASGAIYFLLGDLQEALLLLAFATISVGIAIVQESRSENVLKALRDLIQGARPAHVHPQRQRRTVWWLRLGIASSASSPASPSRTVGTSACTSP